MDHKMTIREKISLTGRALKVVHNVDRKFLPVQVIGALAMAANPYITLYFSAEIIDELMGKRNVRTLLFYVLCTVMIAFLLNGISAAATNYRDCRNRIIWRGQTFTVNEKILNMDYEYIEAEDIHNKKRMLDEFEYHNCGGIVTLFYNILELVSSGAGLVLSLLFMILSVVWGFGNVGAEYRWILLTGSIVMLFLLMVAVVWMYRYTATAKDKEYQVMTGFYEMDRLGSYFVYEHFNSHETGKDVRLFGQGRLIENIYKNYQEKLSGFHGKRRYLEARSSQVNSAITVILGSLIYLYYGLQALWSVFSIGSIVKYAGATQRFITNFTLFLSTFAKLNVNCRYLEPYFAFLDIQNTKISGQENVDYVREHIIEFQNVTFCYPGSNEAVLKHVSMTIPVGERMAVVGRNGSGKTTFIKLLCRLYDPTEGEILMDGKNIKEYDHEEYQKLFSVVFQDFHLLSAKVAENVAAGEAFDRDRVLECLEKAGIKERINTMPEGIDSLIYKQFDSSGIEISGGESQKIAIARAIYKDAPFVILDEPTAALDPIAENEIYARFDSLIQGKTAVYISHRLSSCRFCDRILVFDQAGIVQQGSHDELVGQREGLYYKLWQAQAEYYHHQETDKNC